MRWLKSLLIALKTLISHLCSNLRRFVSLIAPILVVVVVILSVIFSMKLSHDVIYVDREGRPLQSRKLTEPLPEKQVRLINLVLEPGWNEDPEKVAEYERLISGQTPSDPADEIPENEPLLIQIPSRLEPRSDDRAEDRPRTGSRSQETDEFH